jgi:hypothetical protein
VNRPVHRIGACFGKEALKTHALQTFRDRWASPNHAKRLECGSVRLAEPVRFIGAFRLARDGPRFVVPMHGRNAEGAFHEPTHSRPLPGGEQAFVRVLSVPLLGGVRGGFMVPMHAKKRKGAFHKACAASQSRFGVAMHAQNARQSASTISLRSSPAQQAI